MAIFNFPAALLVFFCTLVFSLSVPAAQQISERDTSPAVILPASFSNLAAPPPIPSFDVQLQFEQRPSLILSGVYNTAIRSMAAISKAPYGRYANPNNKFSDDSDREEISITSLPVQGRLLLQYKHIVQAIYEAGTALARNPTMSLGRVPSLYARLYLQNQLVGIMQWQHKSNSVAGEANGTVSLLNTVNPTAALQLVHSDNSAGLKSHSGSVVDREDPRFTVTYQVSDQDVYLPETFSAFLEAMATAAQYDSDAVGAVVSTVGVSGDIAVNMHGTGTPNTLAWGHLIQTLLIVWDVVGSAHYPKAIDFQLLFDGAKIAEGEVFRRPIGPGS